MCAFLKYLFFSTCFQSVNKKEKRRQCLKIADFFSGDNLYYIDFILIIINCVCTEDVFNICGRFVIISGGVHCSVVLLSLDSHRQVRVTFSSGSCHLSA